MDNWTDDVQEDTFQDVDPRPVRAAAICRHCQLSTSLLNPLLVWYSPSAPRIDLHAECVGDYMIHSGVQLSFVAALNRLH